MKYIKSNNQAWRGLVLVALMAAMQMVQAVPAYRGWVTKTQPDGTVITVRQCGDEFYHYWENEQRQQVQEDSLGYWQVVGNAPTPATVAERRASNPMYRSKMAVVDANGVNGPARVGALNLAPRGLFILVNFSDKSFNASNTQAAMNDMMNAANYTYNGAVGSARQYFIDQSNGAYTPTFDVVGPVTLTKATSYYGSNVGGERGEDAYAGDMIIEACKLADTQFGVDFTRYDNDGDGKVDFVYVIYAGKGEADGGAASTIWPHNWNLTSARYYGNCTYTASQCKVDGKYIDNYACSGELNGSTGRRAGIGTLCHEFSHVLGLPDYYDTEYGTNYDNEVTPGDWSLMDQGSYNGSGNCPPNYSIFDKFYMGWCTPTVLKTADNITLPDPSLSANYGVGYYINSNGSTLASATSSTAVQYYIENRQQTGWDTRLPGHGMLVWQVKYDSSAWADNEPNNTAGSPRYTIVSAKGTAKVQNTNYDTYPGSGNKRSYTPFAAYPLMNITENTTAKTVSFLFMGGAAINNYVSLDADLEGVTPNTALGTQITKADGFVRTFTAAECYYDLASENYLIELTIGGVDKTDMYVSRTGSTVTINIPSAALTGNVEIAFYNDKKAEVIVEADGTTVTGAADCVEKETTFQCTITPASGYSLAQDDIEVLMGSTELVPGVGFTYVGTTFRVPNVQDDLYILAHVKAGITWNVQGENTIIPQNIGEALQLPANPTDCSAQVKFVGWTATQNYQSASTAPGDLFVSSPGNVTAPATYYAVYATQSGGGQDTISYGWEAGDDASAWSFSNFVNSNTAITAATGSKYGATNATSTAYIATKGKIASPVSISYRYSKVTNNTNSSSWIVQVSSNGSAWTDVDTKSASSATKGTWSPSGTIDLSSYSDVYVRIYYTGSTAIRTLDDVMLVAGSAPVYSEFTTECVAPVTTIDIPITGGIWHYVSFPVDVTDDKINYAGNGVWGTYNSTTRANGFSGWEHTNPAETPLQANMGYIFYGDVDGTLSIDIDPATLPQTDMQVSLTAYPSFSNDNADWNFVGNPYYAQYDIRNIDPDDTSLWLTLWDGVGYQTKSTNRHAYLLRPFEAFFLQKGTTDHLSFYADSRAAAPVRALRVNDEQFVEIAATVAGYTDHAYLVIDETAGLQYEAGQDVAKFMTATAPVQVYWVDNDEVACAVYARPEGDDSIRLGYSVPEESEVTISAQTMEQTYYLYDAMTGEMVDLRMGDYHFASQAGTYTQRITLRRIPTVSTGMSIDNEGVQRVQKVLREGQIVIVRNGLCYDLRGNRVE